MKKMHVLVFINYRPMMFSKFQYIGGVWFGQCRSSKRGSLCFGPLESYSCKFCCSVHTYIVSAIFQL